jgi:hypothetical protein
MAVPSNLRGLTVVGAVPPVFLQRVVVSLPALVLLVIVAIDVQVPVGDDGCKTYEPIPVPTKLVKAFAIMSELS